MADQILDALAAVLEVEALDAGETALLLDVAREVAHTSERRHAPLTAFLVGVAAAGRRGERPAAVGAAVSRVRALLEARTPTPDPPAS